MKTESTVLECELDWEQNMFAEEGETYLAVSSYPFKGWRREWKIRKITENGVTAWHDVSDEGLRTTRGPWRTLTKAMAELQFEENQKMATYAVDREFIIEE